MCIRDSYKTALQELVQRENGQVLSYRLTGESGPDHAKVFAMEVLLNDGVIAVSYTHLDVYKRQGFG